MYTSITCKNLSKSVKSFNDLWQFIKWVIFTHSVPLFRTFYEVELYNETG